MNYHKSLELLQKKEELCGELKDHLYPTSLGVVLKHPLVFAVPYFPGTEAILNAQLVEKKKALVAARDKKDWNQYVWLHERPYRITAFNNIESEMDDADYWSVLGSIWVDSENIWQHKRLWKKLLSHRGNPRRMMEITDFEFFDQLPPLLEVFRGHQNRNRCGYSWTLAYCTAHWFSSRFVAPKKRSIAA